MSHANHFAAGLEPQSHEGIQPEIPTDKEEQDIKVDINNVPVMISGGDQIMSAEDVPEGPTTTRAEEWAYYMYYNGDNGVGPGNYAGTLFQSFLNKAAHDKDTGGPCGSGTCMIKFAGTTRTVASTILIINGINFAIMTVVFTTIGSCADYSFWNKYILLVATVVCWAAQFGFLGVTNASQWQAAVALYMLGYVAYGITLVFYASVFPRLARNTPRTKEARQKLDEGTATVEEYEKVEMLERNRLSSISTAHSNWGFLVTLVLNLSVLLPLASNSKVNNYALAFTNCYWVVCGLPWFFLQKDRRGPSFPKGSYWFTIGWKQIWMAAKQYRRLPYSFAFLFAFFLLADGLNTTGTMVGLLQNQHVSFSFLQNTYLGLSQAITSIISCYTFWYLQRYKGLNTKRMFQVTNVITIFIPFWGMLGLWTKTVGFHNTWEFWFYNIIFGLGQAPYYAYAQTMMSDLTPPGYEGSESIGLQCSLSDRSVFFGLFGITNRASSLVGPNVVAAIINKTGNTWDGFIFLFILCLSAALVIAFFVDMEKGRSDAIAFSIEERGLTADVRAGQAGLAPIQ